MIWKPVNHPDILPGYLVSPQGYIKANGVKDKDAITAPSYRSTNGYDFMLLNNKDGKVQLFPIDDIVAMAYVHIPSSLKGKNVKVSHINGDTRDISLDNLQWVEDIEEWRVCTYPGVKPDMYEVSSWGRVRNKNRNVIIGYMNRKGYVIAKIAFDTIHNLKSCPIHRLIAWDFCTHNVGLISKEVNHINGIKTCNHPKNLEIITHELNTKHARYTGLIPKYTFTKLTENDVKEICELLIKANGSLTEVQKTLFSRGKDVSLSTIRGIKYKNVWKSLSDKSFTETTFRERLTEEDLKVISKHLLKFKGSKHVTKEAFNQLSKLYPQLTIRTLRAIKNKELHKNVTDKYFSKGEL